jgi:hypothetical protein
VDGKALTTQRLRDEKLPLRQASRCTMLLPGNPPRNPGAKPQTKVGKARIGSGASQVSRKALQATLACGSVQALNSKERKGPQ